MTSGILRRDAPMLQSAVRSTVQHGISSRRLSRRQRHAVVCFKEDTKSSVWPEMRNLTNYSLSAKNEVLQRAEVELSSFCSRLPDDHEARKCWETYDYLRNKHVTYASGCTREVTSGSPATMCQQLEQLDQLVRELESTGDVENVYHVLEIMKRVDSGDVHVPPADHMPQHEEPEDEQKLLRDALALFEQVDANHDGKIDAAEFEDAMKLLSTELADELPVIFECLDVHGFVEKDQFIDIILAEKTRLQNPNSDAEFLKHMMHYHPKH